MPIGQSRVERDIFGQVRKIQGVCGGNIVLYAVTDDGRLIRCYTPEIKKFIIPRPKLASLLRQFSAVVSANHRRAEKFSSIEKPNWQRGLENFGVSITGNGELLIYHWKKTGFSLGKQLAKPLLKRN